MKTNYPALKNKKTPKKNPLTFFNNKYYYKSYGNIPTYEKLLFKTLSQIEEIERLKTLMTLSTVKDSRILPFNYQPS